MTLLRELFEQFSRFHYAQFLAKADECVPLSLLEFAEVSDAPLRRRVSRIAELLAGRDARHSANSELYPPLHRLASGQSPATAEADVRLLELHLGLVDRRYL